MTTGTGVTVTSGCTASEARGGGPPAAEPRLRRSTALESRELLARYRATAKAHPDLADRLRPLRDEVTAHIRELDTEQSSPGSTQRRDRPAPTVPKDEDQALAELARQERLVADARTKALVTAPPEVARLLASLAAAGATHALLLGEKSPVDGQGGAG
ncbi:hypothetical protein [Streptomyces sp. NPDC005438]|uniref:hypothetical protein n=1 Tax=Streptomyces sp. NPDC005438 TaxID=3156880 RepID=UPI0033A473BC